MGRWQPELDQGRIAQVGQRAAPWRIRIWGCPSGAKGVSRSASRVLQAKDWRVFWRRGQWKLGIRRGFPWAKRVGEMNFHRQALWSRLRDASHGNSRSWSHPTPWGWGCHYSCIARFNFDFNSAHNDQDFYCSSESWLNRRVVSKWIMDLDKNRLWDEGFDLANPITVGVNSIRQESIDDA